MALTTRTTADEVGEIVEVDSTISLTAFIQTASVLVTRFCTGDLGPADGYSTEELELIERWLAAHFYRIRDQQPASEKIGSAAQSFQYRVDRGLETTMFGAQAMLLDWNGGLANWNEQMKSGKSGTARMIWLGKTYPE